MQALLHLPVAPPSRASSARAAPRWPCAALRYALRAAPRHAGALRSARCSATATVEDVAAELDAETAELLEWPALCAQARFAARAAWLASF